MKIVEIEEQPGFDPTGVVNFILKHCRPWADLYRLDKPLYRGSSSIESEVQLIQSRTSRQPKDTDVHRHDMFNAVIYAAGGIANRSNSFFTSGWTAMAENYGNVFAFYPIGEFNYTWSPFYTDWTIDFNSRNIASLLSAEAQQLVKSRASNDFDLYRDSQVLSTVKNPSNYSRGRVKRVVHADLGREDFARAYNKGHEIMIKCDKALMIPVSLLPVVAARLQQGSHDEA